MVRAAGAMLVCRKWPGFLLLVLPSNTKVIPRKDFPSHAPKGTGILAAKGALDALH